MSNWDDNKRREYYREYSKRNRKQYSQSRKKYTDKRRALLNEIKLESGCSDCGYNEHAVALDFDHVRGRKLFTIGSHMSRTWPHILREVAKCEVVCANCHRVRTSRRRKKKSGVRHGRRT